MVPKSVSPLNDEVALGFISSPAPGRAAVGAACPHPRHGEPSAAMAAVLRAGRLPIATAEGALEAAEKPQEGAEDARLPAERCRKGCTLDERE